MTRTTFIDEPTIGAHVRVSHENPAGQSSGIYLGVALDEEDGVPYHYFRDGEINGIAQSSFGFPAANDTPLTTDKTPTRLITEAA